MSRTCILYVLTRFRARYRCVEYTFNVFGARFMHVNVRYMRVPILQDIASVTCPKRV